MTTTFRKVAVNTMRSMVAVAIREAIRDGELQPGERLVERNLAAQFGASLSVIREALVELETEGFIVKHCNTATFVTKVTVEDAAKVFQFRAVLEPYAAALAARRANSADIDELRDIHNRMCERARSGDCPGYLREDYRWHERVWIMAGNDYIRTSLARALVPLYAFFAMRSPATTFDMTGDSLLHLRILESLERNDPASAQQTLQEAMSHWRLRPHLYAAPDGSE